MNNQETNNIYINDRISIPESELSFRFSVSGGPGGQHANRSATRVTLSFDVANSHTLVEALSATKHQRLLTKLAPRLDQEGILQITVQDSRSQHQNRQVAVDRFQSMLREALKEPKKRIKTRPSRRANERRLQSKQRQSRKKKDRGNDWSKG